MLDPQYKYVCFILSFSGQKEDILAVNEYMII